MLCYLLNTIDTTLEYHQPKTDEINLRIECDASYNAFSMFCTMIFMNDCLIHVDVTRNKSESITDTVTLTSSVHAEMGAAYIAAKNAVSGYKIISPYIRIKLPIMLMNDAKSALFNLENLVTNKRTMHLDVKYRYVTELVNKGFITLLHKGTKELLADFGTKALVPAKFILIVEKILCLIYSDKKLSDKITVTLRK